MSKKNKEQRIRVSADTIRKLDVIKYFYAQYTGTDMSFDRVISEIISDSHLKDEQENIQICDIPMSYILRDNATMIVERYSKEEYEALTPAERKAIEGVPFTVAILEEIGDRIEEKAEAEADAEKQRIKTKINGETK